MQQQVNRHALQSMQIRGRGPGSAQHAEQATCILGADEATARRDNSISSKQYSMPRSLLWGTLFRFSMPAIHDMPAEHDGLLKGVLHAH